MSTSHGLHQDNLVPFYLLEDRLKDNFRNIGHFIDTQHSINDNVALSIDGIRVDHGDFKQEIGRRLVELEKKIVGEIGRELEGRIIVAINKKMASFTSKMEEKEQEIEQFSAGITGKLEAMKKHILYESSKDNQKALAKEVEKIDKKIKSVEDTAWKVQGQSTHSLMGRPSSRERDFRASQREEPTAP
jgi:hypothetical protein